MTSHYLLTVLYLFVVWSLNDIKCLNGALFIERFILAVKCNYSTLSIISNLVITYLSLTQSEHRVDRNVELSV